MKARTTALVAGGGPAGATTATLLAREGIDVTLFEADRFPRYHIGESIQPSCLPIFEKMGVREKIDNAGFIRKYGAYFDWGRQGEQFTLDFSHLDTADNWGYQVIRSEFDRLLLDHARSQGVDVREGQGIHNVEFDGDRAVAATYGTPRGPADGRIDFDYLVDATGRAGLLASRQLRIRRTHDAYRNIAVWGYWRGARPFDRGPEGAVVIQSTRLGWFWIIPLHNGTTSIGLVLGKDQLAAERARLGSMEEVYAAAIAECPLTAELLADARRDDHGVQADKDFCYSADRFAGPGYFIAGDSACFIDPLLTTGVHLATFSGLLAAASIASVVRGDVPEAKASGFYEKAYRQAYERLLVLVSFLYRDFAREAQLFEASQLTRRQRRLFGLYESFLDVTSGVEDLRDAADGEAVEAVSGRLRSSGHLSAQVMGGLPLSGHETVSGLYLTTDPVLGLSENAPATEEMRV